MSEVFLNQLTARLESLPPDINKFNATADFLFSYASISNQTQTYQIATWPTIGLYLLLAVQSIVLLGIRQPSRFKAWFTVDRGLIRPNASNCFALCNILNSAVNIADLVYQNFLISQGLTANYAGWTAVVAMRYIPLFWAGWLYGWAACAAAMSSRAQGDPLPRGRGAPTVPGRVGLRRAEVWTSNILGSAIMFTSMACAILFGILSRNSYNSIFTTISQTAASLRAVAGSYDPATFSLRAISPLLLSLAPLAPQQVNFVRAFSAMLISWIAHTFILVVIFTPIAFRHVRTLKSIKNYNANQRVASYNSRGKCCAWLPVMTEYRSLLVTMCLVYFITMLYTPLATWSLVLTQRSEGRSTARSQFNFMLLIWAQLGYAVVGNMIVAVLLAQTIRTLRASEGSSSSARNRQGSDQLPSPVLSRYPIHAINSPNSAALPGYTWDGKASEAAGEGDSMWIKGDAYELDHKPGYAL